MIKHWLFRNLYQYRRYIFYNAWYEMRYRYAGTGIGILWNLIHPLCEILIYTVVFSLLLSRGVRGSSYALYLMSGLLPWRTFAETIAQGSNAFIQNSIYLRRLAIPSEVFVAKASLTSLFLLLVYLALVLPIAVVLNGNLGLGIFLLPVLGLLLQGLGFGMGLILANLQTLFPDVKQILQFVIPLWSWTIPIFYPETVIPKNILPWLYLNPPYAFIESVRHLILENKIPEIHVWLIMTAWVSLFMWLSNFMNYLLQDEIRDVI
ncbi:ABC transporter permease [Nostoc sp. FACHB-152]|uniref:ABC transporter permease n=1 Tax=unclassified Nostoc TaxID=2593658 RepID=UPI001689209B|nr:MULTISPECIES: ABC transporter permease [unclassified Nostoc]MBD2451334.1 ABC transporter permease [Nostoc sp. FACHB-152]MBD2466295.1 ABC transporter permease [Nostoc sp. FACHB-145]